MQPMRAGSKALIREINAARVLGELRAQTLQSRTDLAKRTGLSLPTVSEIVAELIDMGVVEERTTGRSTGGRRPVLLAIKPDAGYAVGIKLTETRVIAVLTDLEATIVARDVTAVPDTSVHAVVDAVGGAVARLLDAAHGRPVHGVGVGMAGVVDRTSGLVRHATYSDWHDVDLAGLLTRRVGLPVVLDNDVNTLVANENCSAPAVVSTMSRWSASAGASGSASCSTAGSTAAPRAARASSATRRSRTDRPARAAAGAASRP